MAETGSSIRSFAKGIANIAAIVLVSPCGLLSWLEKRATPRGETVFGFWTNVFAMMPGLPGMYLRRAFYYLALDSCSIDCYIGFGTLFTHRQVVVEDKAYVGPYSLIGSARLREGCLLGSRVSLLSGSSLHTLDEHGRWMPSDRARLQQVEIGEYSWIGEGAIVMVNVGAGALVGTGAVVSTRVPPRVVVAGNPARFVRRLGPEEDAQAAASSVETEGATS